MVNLSLFVNLLEFNISDLGPLCYFEHVALYPYLRECNITDATIILHESYVS